jgi:Family of unknown function (DUF6165)
MELAMPDVPVSWGDLVDRITILQIKRDRLTDAAAVANVARELAALEKWDLALRADERLTLLRSALVAVNEALWDIEDRIREREALSDFGPEFIELARSVYKQNDRRAAIKRQVNLALASEFIEEKSHGSARPA